MIVNKKATVCLAKLVVKNEKTIGNVLSTHALNQLEIALNKIRS